MCIRVLWIIRPPENRKRKKWIGLSTVLTELELELVEFFSRVSCLSFSEKFLGIRFLVFACNVFENDVFAGISQSSCLYCVKTIVKCILKKILWISWAAFNSIVVTLYIIFVISLRRKYFFVCVFTCVRSKRFL